MCVCVCGCFRAGYAIFGEFVHNFGWVFAILFEGLSIEIQEEILHFAVLGGGVKEHQNRRTKIYMNKMRFPIKDEVWTRGHVAFDSSGGFDSFDGSGGFLPSAMTADNGPTKTGMATHASRPLTVWGGLMVLINYRYRPGKFHRSSVPRGRRRHHRNYRKNSLSNLQELRMQIWTSKTRLLQWTWWGAALLSWKGVKVTGVSCCSLVLRLQCSWSV